MISFVIFKLTTMVIETKSKSNNKKSKNYVLNSRLPYSPNSRFSYSCSWRPADKHVSYCAFHDRNKGSAPFIIFQQYLNFKGFLGGLINLSIIFENYCVFFTPSFKHWLKNFKIMYINDIHVTTNITDFWRSR